MDRRTSAAMRLLPERADHDCQGAARPQSPSDGRADPSRDGWNVVPLHDLLPGPGRHKARGEGDGMKTSTHIPACIEAALERQYETRRGFLKTAGLLAVSFGASTMKAQTPGPYPDPDFRQLDSWIVIHEDNTATFYVGKTDCGQGTGTAFRQMMADELDIAYDKTTCIMGSTDITIDQGGSGGSDAIQTDGWPMRRVAAEARRVLLEMGSTRLGVPVDQLTVSEGVIAMKADPSKRVTYGELIGGKRFNVALTADRNNVYNTTGVAKVKPVQELKNVGK